MSDSTTFGSGSDPPKVHQRERPDPRHARKMLVTLWNDRVVRARDYWKDTFDRMRWNMRFCEGYQWPRTLGQDPNLRDDRYVANITLRHVQQRTAALYASNPAVVARRRERMMNTTWDGDPTSLAAAQQSMANAAQAAAQIGQPPQFDPNAMAVIADAQNVHEYNKLMDRVAKTLQLFYNYNIDEQVHPFKVQMKACVRKAIITAVGYVKVGFQRAMQMDPEVERRIADMSERLANIERIAADIADKETDSQSAEAEELRLALQSLRLEPQLIVREGLEFNYPDSWALIPDMKCRSLRSFIGADWVAEEYLLTPDQVQEVYRVDVGIAFNAWSLEGEPISTPRTPLSNLMPGGMNEQIEPRSFAMVWEIYNRKDGNVYTICDGWPDFLREPAPPECKTERFWPWFAIVMNEAYCEHSPYPPSDVDLLRDPQLEINRARQGLREHRRANRPKMVAPAGVLEEDDKDKLKSHPANALIELNAIAPGQKVEEVLTPLKMPPIDPALYDTTPSFEDVLRVVGTSQPDMGETPASATATETAASESARHTDLQSVIDDLDEVLTAIAQTSGQILLENVSQQTVQSVLGPGASWPQLDVKTIQENVYLEVEAGSTGRPNKQQEVQNMAILIPLLQRIPGISPTWLATQVIRRMDDRLDISEALQEGLPSMESLNATGAGVPPGTPGPGPTPGPAPVPGPPMPGHVPGPGVPTVGTNAPAMQGPAGMHNLPGGPPVAGMAAPRMPGLSPNPAREATAPNVRPMTALRRGPLGVVPHGPGAGGPVT